MELAFALAKLCSVPLMLSRVSFLRGFFSMGEMSSRTKQSVGDRKLRISTVDFNSPSCARSSNNSLQQSTYNILIIIIINLSIAPIVITLPYPYILLKLTCCKLLRINPAGRVYTLLLLVLGIIATILLYRNKTTRTFGENLKAKLLPLPTISFHIDRRSRGSCCCL